MISPSMTPNEKQNFQSFMTDPDSFMRFVKVPSKCMLSFEVRGIPFNAQQITTDSGSKLILWGTLGILPYTVTNAKKRQSLIKILESARCLPNVLIGIDKEMKIIVRSAHDITHASATNYLFEPLINMLQEAGPFIRLIGDYL